MIEIHTISENKFLIDNCEKIKMCEVTPARWAYFSPRFSGYLTSRILILCKAFYNDGYFKIDYTIEGFYLDKDGGKTDFNIREFNIKTKTCIGEGINVISFRKMWRL